MSSEPVDVEAICLRLETMHSHRGDGLPTQFVNPDGRDGAKAIRQLAFERNAAIRSKLALLDACDREEARSDAAVVRADTAEKALAEAREWRPISELEPGLEITGLKAQRVGVAPTISGRLYDLIPNAVIDRWSGRWAVCTHFTPVPRTLSSPDEGVGK